MVMYQPKEFIDRLKDGTLRRPLSVVGMAKTSEDGNSLLLDPTMRCRKWIEIPVEMIAKKGVEWLGDVPCKEHEHPLVRIELQHDESGQSDVLARLLSATAGGAFFPNPNGDIPLPTCIDICYWKFEECIDLAKPSLWCLWEYSQCATRCHSGGRAIGIV